MRLARLPIAPAATRPVAGGVALEAPHLDLSVSHDYHELAEANAYFIGLTRFEPSQVKTFKLSVVRQGRNSNSQRKPVYKHCPESLCCSGGSVRFLVDFPQPGWEEQH